MTTFFRLFLFGAWVFQLNACSVSDRFVYEDSEGVVTQDFFASIQKNKTSKQWVMDNLGHPYAVVVGPNNEEIYTYFFKRSIYRETSLFFVLRYQSSENSEQYYHMIFCDNVVKREWWDSFSSVQTERHFKHVKCMKPMAPEMPPSGDVPSV